MSVTAALASHCKEDADIAAIVGSRIYRQEARPRAPLPYIVIRQVGADHQRHMTAAAGLVQTVCSVECYGSTPNQSDDLADAVRESLDHKYSGDIGLTPNTVTVDGCFLDSESDLFIPPSDGGEQGSHMKSQTWIVWHTESIPTFS